jgi:hypothetical protein
MNTTLIVILIALLLYPTAVFVDCFWVDAWVVRVLLVGVQALQRYQKNTVGTRIAYLRGYL